MKIGKTFFFLLIIFTFTFSSCSLFKGGGGGKKCDCPKFGQQTDLSDYQPAETATASSLE